LSIPTTDASDDDSFWSKVPEHLGDGTLLDDEEGWIDRLKKRLPVGKDADSDEDPDEESS
jgi:hypothetical protein